MHNVAIRWLLSPDRCREIRELSLGAIGCELPIGHDGPHRDGVLGILWERIRERVPDA